MSLQLMASYDGTNMPSRLRSIVQARAPVIKINVASKKKIYTTLDRIEGTVSITCPTDLPFDEVSIELVGTSRTFIEKMATAAAMSGRSEAFHQFLRLTQPDVAHQYPGDNIFKAGTEYQFAFVFVVPQHLLPRICQHKAKSAGIPDDLAPEMSSVRYGIFVKICNFKATDDGLFKRDPITTRARRLRIMPVVEEQPPLVVDDEESEYIMRKQKETKKGIFKGKNGVLSMEAAQPASFSVSARHDPEQRTTSMATVMLRFDPVDRTAALPKLGNLVAKLKVATYFASTARHHFPSKKNSAQDLSQGIHSEQMTLASRCMGNVEWVKVDPAKPSSTERRDSACSAVETGNIPAPSEGYTGQAYYTARLLVPITLPANKTFVPTFHTCLISRVYQLKLELGLSGIGQNINLKVPIQISSENASTDAIQRRASGDSITDEGEMEDDDVTDFFEPRSMRSPDGGFVGRSRIGSQAPINDELPGYSPYVPPGGSRRRSSARVLSGLN
ncbi:hypothetical protein LTR78_006063 [Recurvomyces mirabilis]|uniref:Bul1 C-terminal domain-containing protein n=1 Tax=Recurvomyces mirabilis TaxID=574656 RepID=A0AAE1C0W8_9PEZI|nr:hypothetical protein LTR78_006063 [Recurvomyces mirabilis]KAK5155126.1 hypothetical protein LTS14_006081 [Recurvomyces mirabilis]